MNKRFFIKGILKSDFFSTESQGQTVKKCFMFSNGQIKTRLVRVLIRDWSTSICGGGVGVQATHFSLKHQMYFVKMKYPALRLQVSLPYLGMRLRKGMTSLQKIQCASCSTHCYFPSTTRQQCCNISHVEQKKNDRGADKKSFISCCGPDIVQFVLLTFYLHCACCVFSCLSYSYLTNDLKDLTEL